MSFSLPFPTGQSIPQLYNHQLALVQALQRLLSSIQGADVTALTAQVAELETQIAALETEIASDLALIRSPDDVVGSLAELTNRTQTELERNAFASINAAIEAHRATTGVRSQISVTEGHAQLITQLSASLGVTNASVTTLQQAVATGDAALASDITTLETSVAGNTAAITATQSSVNGVLAKATVAISIQGRVVGTQTLAGSPLGSVFSVDADVFRVGSISYPDRALFAIGTKGGVADIGISGNMYLDGTITANHLAANSVSTDKLAAGAVTAGKIAAGAVTATTVAAGAITAGKIAAGVVTSTELSSSAVTAEKIAAGAITADKISAGTITADQIVTNGLTGSVSTAVVENTAAQTSGFTFVDLPGMTIDVTTGANEKILLTFTAAQVSNFIEGQSPRAAEFQIVRNGVKVPGTAYLSYPFFWNGQQFVQMWNPNVSVAFITTPPAGTHTYKVQWRDAIQAGSSTAFPVTNNFRSFALMRFIK